MSNPNDPLKFPDNDRVEASDLIEAVTQHPERGSYLPPKDKREVFSRSVQKRIEAQTGEKLYTQAELDKRIAQERLALQPECELLIEHLERYMAQYPPDEMFVIRHNPAHDIEFARERIANLQAALESQS